MSAFFFPSVLQQSHFHEVHFSLAAAFPETHSILQLRHKSPGDFLSSLREGWKTLQRSIWLHMMWGQCIVDAVYRDADMIRLLFPLISEGLWDTGSSVHWLQVRGRKKKKNAPAASKCICTDTSTLLFLLFSCYISAGYTVLPFTLTTKAQHHILNTKNIKFLILKPPKVSADVRFLECFNFCMLYSFNTLYCLFPRFSSHWLQLIKLLNAVTLAYPFSLRFFLSFFFTPLSSH